MSPDTRATAFVGTERLAAGRLLDVALAISRADPRGASILTFDDQSGAVIDLDLRGSAEEIETRLRAAGERSGPAAPRGRGRPRLGVTAREITLLPRHWDWLAAQSGGVSATLRRLVDEARHADTGATATRQARDRCYRFLSALAGDLPGFEDIARALFAGDRDGFARRIAAWPVDVRTYAVALLETGTTP